MKKKINMEGQFSLNPPLIEEKGREEMEKGGGSIPFGTEGGKGITFFLIFFFPHLAVAQSAPEKIPRRHPFNKKNGTETRQAYFPLSFSFNLPERCSPKKKTELEGPGSPTSSERGKKSKPPPEGPERACLLFWVRR